MQNQPNRLLWVDHLRSFITLLVIAHHACLAYTTFGYFNKEAYILSTHPVIDMAKARGFDVFVHFNDIFFMSLMFFISGIFTLKGIEQKGAASFLRDRFYRLFLPFIMGVTLLMLIAFYPAYLLSEKPPGLINYIADFFTVEAWPVGPPWFIWVLFLFNVFLALFPLLRSLIISTGKRINRGRKSVIIFLTLFILTLLLYIPPALVFGSETWTGIGPFDFQKSRLLLYFGYFLLGSAIGSAGLKGSILSSGSSLFKPFWLWIFACISSFLLLLWAEQNLSGFTKTYALNELTGKIIYLNIYVISIISSCLAFLSFFSNFANGESKVWKLLSANAYSMYLTHYIFIVWIQYALFDISLPILLKTLLVFALSSAGSLFVSVMLRRIPVIKKYV